MSLPEETFPIHPIVEIILYSNCRKTPWEVLGDMCKYDENGNIDVEWTNSLDEEQILRLDIAATVQQHFNDEYKENAKNWDLMKENVTHYPFKIL